MSIFLRGSLEDLLADLLPHEVTHTIFAHHFRKPLPRWADEGGAVLASKSQRDRFKRDLHHLVQKGRAIPMSRLFVLEEYPDDLTAMYSQGYSVTEFLVARKDRPIFLAFVKKGMEGNWDRAAKEHYGFASVKELESAWLAHVRQPAEGDTVTRRGGWFRKPLLCVLAERPPAPTPRRD